MTESFARVSTAARYRDLFRKIARREIDRAVPPDEFGVVLSVDTDTRRAAVLFSDSDEPKSFSYGFASAPTEGDSVRITGRAGSRYIVSATSGLSAAAGFPITYDDGTYTYLIDIDGSSIIVEASDNSDPTNIRTRLQIAAGNSSITSLDNPGGGYESQLTTFVNAGGSIKAGTQFRVLGNALLDAGHTATAPVFGFFGATPVVQQDISGDGGDKTLASILAALVAYGLVTDSAIEDGDSYVAASVSGSVTVDFATAHTHKLTMTGNISSLTLSGATSGVACSLTLYLVQDATGSRTIAWPGSVKWPGGTAPVLSTGANKIDIVVMETVDGGTTWFANLAGKGYA